jgi:uncharacterized protein
VAAFYASLVRGDFGTARKALSTTLEWVESNQTILWSARVHQGACGLFNELILPAYGRIAEFRFEVEQLLNFGEHVVVIGRFRGRAKNSGKEINVPGLHVWTLSENKAVAVRSYNDPVLWSDALKDADFGQMAA